MPRKMMSVPIDDDFHDFQYRIGDLVSFRHDLSRDFTVSRVFLERNSSGVFFPVYDLRGDDGEVTGVLEKLITPAKTKGDFEHGDV